MPADLTAASATTFTATMMAGAASVPVLVAAPEMVPQIVVFGVALGLRADVLLAGFSGSVVAIALLNAGPASADTRGALLRDTSRRFCWCMASALTSGYLTPLALLIERETLRIPDSLILSLAFVVGAGAQRWLTRFIKRGDKPAAQPAQEDDE